MTTIDSIRRLVEAKKYKPVDIEVYHGRYLVWLDSIVGVTGTTLNKRFKDTGWDAQIFGYDVERKLWFFYLKAE
ncbi:MAG: hypothetical protein ACYTBJ_26975 [Planctomycetota bacterium]|jgi:hypothetical protein